MIRRINAVRSQALRIPVALRKTLTYDQGKEMSYHDVLTLRTGVAVYFADPHSPRQRGSNENTNGLLRQYLPKGTDLSVYSQDELNQIALNLNTRPRQRQRHGFHTPLQVYNEYRRLAEATLGTMHWSCCTGTLKPPVKSSANPVRNVCHVFNNVIPFIK